MPTQPTTRRLRSAAEGLALLEPEEPSSSLLVSDLQQRGVGRKVKAWVVEDGSGPLGVLVLSRLCADRWQGFPFLFAPAGAEPVARLIDRSSAFRIHGPAHHIDPLVPHVTRARSLVSLPVIGVKAVPDFADAAERFDMIEDDRTRLATPADLDGLVDLFNGYELDHVPTVPRLRRYLREFFELDRPIVVIEDEGTIVGALRFDAVTKHYLYLGAQTVLPDHRGKGYSHVLMSRGATFAVGLGLGGIVTRSNRNPVPIRTEPADPERAARIADPDLWQEAYEMFTGQWYELYLDPPRRIRGANRARLLVERIEGPVRRRPPPEAYPEERPEG